MLKRIAIGLVVALVLFVVGVIATVMHLQSVKEDVKEWGEPINMLSMLQVYSEGYLTSNRTYQSFCSWASDEGITASVASVAGKVDCYDGSDAWAAGVILPIKGAYYCVDSTGVKSTTVRGLNLGETACPAEQPW